MEGGLRAQGLGETVIEPRVHLRPDEAFRGHFNVLRGYIAPLGLAGVKVVGDYVDNYQRGLPSENGLLTLYDPRTGVPQAVIDAAGLTDMRTGAVTALGARHLARRDARVLGHIGARGTAYWNVRLLAHLFDLDEIRVHSRRPESRAAFGARLERDLGRPVRVCDDWESVVRGADIVVEAARLEQPEPLLRTEWIAPGALVVPYGTMSAVELSLTDVMDKLVVDDWGQCRSGPFGSLRAHVEAGKLSEQTLYGELGEIVAGREAGARARRRDDPVLAPRPEPQRHRAGPCDAREGGAPGHRPAAALRLIGEAERGSAYGHGPQRPARAHARGRPLLSAGDGARCGAGGPAARAERGARPDRVGLRAGAHRPRQLSRHRGAGGHRQDGRAVGRAHCRRETGHARPALARSRARARLRLRRREAAVRAGARRGRALRASRLAAGRCGFRRGPAQPPGR